MLFALDHTLSFPPVDRAEPDGLLAIGGDLSTQRLLMAYREGIFPWYEGDTPLWWCPDPRFVLYPPALKVSKSMKGLFRKGVFTYATNQNFPAVIRACKQTPRKGQAGTWITDEVERAYTELHRLGYAHSAETWQDGVLVGGLYGIRLGRVFFGESMFSHVSNASKFAFISYVEQLRAEGVELIDCQVYTAYLESLGAQMIPRSEFVARVRGLL
ncbi:leucyl/phenylalanyl-tRNA--protein transferase [Dinghuibacter silviterrae]|uniref:Leucyl/phenylalanyl-tRNA--protein transferase n=1 Tax=Dinghuibacter silviterrae TaxID=1539049 RepID=A0A4R8DF53_9BACT|nr:leucyl/phenylalanyl-tRNA--protein transferase [Dinghuibacter silviterrae]TDW96047.1 leucyl/phenylalanyl-tRNA--protein transferase [Dinghuibacter silviterrae]